MLFVLGGSKLNKILTELVIPMGMQVDQQQFARTMAKYTNLPELEEILHPLIWEQRARWLKARRVDGEGLVVSEVPLLFETGREGDFGLSGDTDLSVRRPG